MPNIYILEASSVKSLAAALATDDSNGVSIMVEFILFSNLQRCWTCLQYRLASKSDWIQTSKGSEIDVFLLGMLRNERRE